MDFRINQTTAKFQKFQTLASPVKTVLLGIVSLGWLLHEEKSIEKTILLFLNEVEFYETCGNFVYAGLPFDLGEVVWNLTLSSNYGMYVDFCYKVIWLNSRRVMNYLFKK